MAKWDANDPEILGQGHFNFKQIKIILFKNLDVWETNRK